MKQKDRIDKIESDITETKGIVERILESREKDKQVNYLDTKLINDRAKVDWESAASVMKHYIVSDISRLIPVAEPFHAGPLYYVTLNAITAISGLCYGFGNIKRSFIKFAMLNMELEESLAELLYVCRMKGCLGYFPRHVMINTKKKNCDIFELHENRIIVNVVILAKEFLLVLESMDYRAMKCKLPRQSENERDIHSQVLEYLREDGIEDVN